MQVSGNAQASPDIQNLYVNRHSGVDVRVGEELRQGYTSRERDSDPSLNSDRTVAARNSLLESGRYEEAYSRARSYLEERGLLSSSRNGRSPASVNEDGSVNTSARQERTNAMALSSYRQVQGQAERFSLESMLGVSVYA